jgi:hypothetical protein
MATGHHTVFPPLTTAKLFGLIAAIVAVVFALLYAAQFVPPQHPVLRAAIQSFAALLLTSGIVSVIFNILVRRELADFWLAAIGVRDTVSIAGVYDVGLDFNAYDFRTLVREAKDIDLCVIHADKWIGSRLNDFKEFLSHTDHKLRVCLLHEESDSVPVLSRDFRYKDGELKQKIDSAVAALQSCITELQKANQSTGWLRIWKHHRAPKHTYYRFDDLFFLVPYNLAAGHTKIPVLGFSRKEGGMSDFLSVDFERMVNEHSEKVYDSREERENSKRAGELALTNIVEAAPTNIPAELTSKNLEE